ncbi:TPA: hypothetical protein ACODIX_004757 [Salmonella enterica subsp. salamae serovar 1,4,12,[27]:b:[e,n,x]]
MALVTLYNELSKTLRISSANHYEKNGAAISHPNVCLTPNFLSLFKEVTGSNFRK